MSARTDCSAEATMAGPDIPTVSRKRKGALTSYGRAPIRTTKQPGREMAAPRFRRLMPVERGRSVGGRHRLGRYALRLRFGHRRRGTKVALFDVEIQVVAHFEVRRLRFLAIDGDHTVTGCADRDVADFRAGNVLHRNDCLAIGHRLHGT